MPDNANEIIDILTVGNPDIDQNMCAFYVHNMHTHPTFKNPRIVRQELLDTGFCMSGVNLLQDPYGIMLGVGHYYPNGFKNTMYGYTCLTMVTIQF